MRIMTRTCGYKTFIWWFLLVGISEIVHTGARLEVNFEKMELLLKNTESIFVDGNRVNLETWARDIKYDDDKLKYGVEARRMFTFFKCECAHLINISLESIIGSVKPCDSADRLLNLSLKRNEATNADVNPCFKKNKAAMQRLRMLNKKIKLTLTRLWQIEDRYPILWSDESYLLRTLLSACFYLESFVYVKKRDHLSDVSAPTRVLRILLNMNRVLLQIMNLVGHYALEYCYPIRNRASGELNPNEELSNLLEDIVLSDASYSSSFSSIRPIDMGVIMLDTCMRSEGSSVCHEYLKTAEIRRPDVIPEVNSTVASLFEVVRHTYDVHYVYEYLLAVYQVILKLIYLKTVDQWSSLSVEQCADIIAKLKSTHCPTEIVYHFQSISDIKRSTKENGKSVEDEYVKSIFKKKFQSVKNVIMDPQAERFKESRWVDLSLSDLMYSVMDDEQFGQFWRVFNFLYREFRKKSSSTYDMSLSLFPEVTFNDPQTIANNEPRCNAWTDVTQYLSDMQPSYEYITKKLFEKLKTGQLAAEGNDLYNAYSTAFIQLENLLELQCENGEILTRTVHLIWNMLDNHAIKTCKNIKDRRFVFRIKTYNYRYEINKKNQKKLLHTSANAIDKINKFGEELTQHALSILYGCNGKKLRSTHERIYDFGKLSGKAIIDIGTLGTTIFFDWRGDIKNLQDIQTYISKNMINIQDLVDFQRLCYKMLCYIFFKMWFVMFDQYDHYQEVNVINIDIYDQSLKDLIETFYTLYFPYPYGKYMQYYLSRLELYSYISKQHYYTGSHRAEIVIKELINPISEVLGVFVRNNRVNISDIKNLLDIDEEIWHTAVVKGYSKLLIYMYEINIKFKTDFKFIPLRDQFFRFTINYDV